jgi:uncharacterized membrane protein
VEDKLHEMKNKLRQISGSWYFLIGVIVVYLLLLFINIGLFKKQELRNGFML